MEEEVLCHHRVSHPCHRMVLHLLAGWVPLLLDSLATAVIRVSASTHLDHHLQVKFQGNSLHSHSRATRLKLRTAPRPRINKSQDLLLSQINSLVLHPRQS